MSNDHLTTDVQCPDCGDIHTVEDRDEEDGGRVCPKCGEQTAVIIDEDAAFDSPI